MKKIMWLLPVIALVISCGGEEEGNFLPLTVGNDWGYAMTMTRTDPDTTTTMTGSNAVAITQQTTLDNGTEVYEMVMTMTPDDTLIQASVDTVYFEQTDDYTLTYDSKADTVPSDTLFSLPLEVGKTWANYEAVRQLDVTVPAGAFSDCWEIREVQTEDTTYTYWASGIGMVKMNETDIEADTTYNLLMEMDDYNVQ
jgi:hypothetical protein